MKGRPPICGLLWPPQYCHRCNAIFLQLSAAVGLYATLNVKCNHSIQLAAEGREASSKCRPYAVENLSGEQLGYMAAAGRSSGHIQLDVSSVSHESVIAAWMQGGQEQVHTSGCRGGLWRTAGQVPGRSWPQLLHQAAHPTACRPT